MVKLWSLLQTVNINKESGEINTVYSQICAAQRHKVVHWGSGRGREPPYQQHTYNRLTSREWDMWNGKIRENYLLQTAVNTFLSFLESRNAHSGQHYLFLFAVVRQGSNPSFAGILVPATEHGYFVSGWWHTPLYHPPKVTRFHFQRTSGIHAPVGKRNGCPLSGRSPAPIADSFHVATMAWKQPVKFTRN
jgi:hypothetical protein